MSITALSKEEASQQLEHERVAAEPSGKASNIAWRVGHVVYLIFEYCSRPFCYVVRKIVATAIIPASSSLNFNAQERDQLHNYLKTNLLYLPNEFEGSVEEINIGPGQYLRGFTIRCRRQDASNDHVVYFGGNGTLAETNLSICEKIATLRNVSVSCFSYSGTGKSDGEILRKEDLLNFGRACIAHVKNKIKEDGRLILWGHSLGGAIAMLLARELELLGENVPAVSDRSFKILPKAIKNLFGPGLGHVAAAIASSLGWDLDAGSAATQIHNKVVVISSDLDRIICGDSKLHSAFEGSHLDNVHSQSYPAQHNDELSNAQIEEALDFIQK